MRVIARPALLEFAARHPDAKASLNAWYRQLRSQDFGSPHELQRAFPKVSFLGGGIAVFNISGNKYRLVAGINYRAGIVFIKHVLTHSEYDEWSATRRRER